MTLPRYLRPYRCHAERLIEQSAIKEVEFAGSTYQVLVEDPVSYQKEWVFLQLEETGEIRDAFCTAPHPEETKGCIHLTAAYLSLFKGGERPLHRRFIDSLWNHLCSLYEERLGGDSHILSQDASGIYYCQSSSGKKIFILRPMTESAAQEFERIIHIRAAETEETSLKFSNLSQEDLLMWREGRPAASLRYDLSFWSDLAKWLMQKQEQGLPYSLSFGYSKKQLPNWFQINFEEVQVGFYISKANLPLLIDSLRTIESPLAVHRAGRKMIARITYDKKNHILHIEEREDELWRPIESDEVFPNEALSLEGWWFIPKKGFYAKEPHPLLRRPVLHGSDIPHVLDEHARLIASLMVDYRVYRDPVPLSYRLHFDQEWNLHIQTYLFEPGDLSKEDAWLMGDWAYLDEDGFYRVEGYQFDHVDNVVGRYALSDFISQHRAWFNSQEGFRTHVRSIEYQLDYEVNEQRRLTFKRTLAISEEGGQQQDFGAWVYLEGYGFYSKTVGSFPYLLKPGISLSPDQIPLFIRMNREELGLIPRFFSSRCPVSQARLKIEWLDPETVRIDPLYEPLPPYGDRKLHLFDDFVYVEGEGFHELPLELRLPEKFRYPLELMGDELSWFLTHEVEALAKCASFIDSRLVKPKEWRLVADSIERWPTKGKGWYRLRLSYQTERGLIPIKPLHEALHQVHSALKEEGKLPFAFFEAGLVDLRDAQHDWLRPLGQDRFESGSEAVWLTALDLIRLHAFHPITLLDSSEAGRKIWDELTEWRIPEAPDAGGLGGHLRPYQEVGLAWLWFLYSQKLSGLLCDDMGLGKTHQAMALFASVANLYTSQAEGSRPYFLVVCPTSVMYHWEEKLKQFLPGLRVCTFYGTKRSLEAFGEQYDVLLTSYGILRNERSLLARFLFEVAIFDEIQLAKNPLSRLHAALRGIKAHMRLGLTGTPIANHLRELKALFDIVLPGYMPREQHYREFFIKPIEKEGSQRRQALLRRLIHPFVLRRKKEAVLQELPEKIEELAHCDLLPYQQQLYAEVLQQRRSLLLQELHDGGHPIPYLHIFALLSSLKQICDHPALYLKKSTDYRQYSSGKWELLLELLREARESGQKVVIFSQYLGMLDIIEAHLEEEQIGFAALRGSTRNRQVQIHAFQYDPECEIFVGSLQAAGLGIDLTAASVVIHYDRWWNAARENQATDRVHRMGQKRGVQVFKLVTKGTFEEKIDAMIARKGKLLEEIVGADEQEAIKVFSREELIELLELADNPLNGYTEV